MGSPFRDTAAGYFIRLISGKRLLKYPEEIPGFSFPAPVDNEDSKSIGTLSEKSTPSSRLAADEKDLSESDGATPAARSPPTNAEDVEHGDHDETLEGSMIHPVKTKDGIILVDWYSTGES